MLDYLLEDWMPWYPKNKDFSLVDINRYVHFELIVLLYFHAKQKYLMPTWCYNVAHDPSFHISVLHEKQFVL